MNAKRGSLVGVALSVACASLGCGAVTADEPKRDASTLMDSGAMPSTSAGAAATERAQGTLSEPAGASICHGLAEFKFEDCAE